jgi:hypothetical protein
LAEAAAGQQVMTLSVSIYIDRYISSLLYVDFDSREMGFIQVA